MISRLLAVTTARVARLVAGTQVVSATALDDGCQRVYVANHTSHLDFVLLWASLPARARRVTRPVAARDYWTRSGLRRYVAERVFDAVLIDRGRQSAGCPSAGREAVDRMLEALADRRSLILFPEGTRGSSDEGVGAFRSGLYHLCAARPGLQVVPVHLANLNRILPRGEFLPVPMLSRVMFGQPIELEHGESRDAFLERARTAVERLAS
jgi:1-acyl-sn-glycerol-3-phosphate acyltransferase